MSERKKNSISLCGVMATAYLVSLSPLSAAETYLGELSLLTDTNAVLNVASGDEVVLERISGDRGTITKTGGGSLRILDVKNDKVKLVVNEGKVRFDHPRTSTLEKAFFHVDSSRADTIVTEVENGTNFVVRWNDVRGNGIFATNCMYTAKWRPDPENRRAFISSVTQNGMPVVDFGEMIHVANTNSLGESRSGYGASMIWNRGCTNAYEVYQVVSDTPDVYSIATIYPDLNDKKDEIRGVSFLSSSKDVAAAIRSRLKSNSYPTVLAYTATTRPWAQGCVYVDCEPTSTKGGGSIYGYVTVGEGFHLLGFTSRKYNEILDYKDTCVRLDSFARDYVYSFGGQRLAEYVVFTNRLTATERTVLQEYLYRKWKGIGVSTEYKVSSISVADGASVEMSSGVTVSIAHISDGADVVLQNGLFEINPLKIPEANFHVDASCAETLSTEMVNGTNFVNQWADTLSNGVYATAGTLDEISSANSNIKSLSFIPDPENRRPFISSEPLNGLPVLDFGPLQVASHTNETGYGVGYGASMKWSKSGMETKEVFSVSRDTEDVDGLSGKGNVAEEEYGIAFICIPEDERLFRGKLKTSGYPVMTVQNASNGGMYGDGAFVKIDDNNPLSGSSTLKNYSPAAGFHVFDFRLSSSGVTPNWFAFSVAKGSGNIRYASFGGTKIAEYIALPVPLSNDVRQAVHSALRTKWFGIEKREMSLKNLAIADKAKVIVPWNSISVAGTFSIGGEVDVSAVSAANVSLTREGAAVSGSLTLAAGATVNVQVGADGTLAGVEAKSVTLSGGGKIVLIKENSGAKTPDIGSYPVIVGSESFSGTLDGWSLDVSVLGKRSCALELRNDGIYLKVAAKGLSFVVR